MSKIQFRKQFTTMEELMRKTNKLYQLCQRYNFESNSQRAHTLYRRLFRCISYVKDTISKAIHNQKRSDAHYDYAVLAMSKIQFRKQFTTAVCVICFHFLLYQLCQRYNFESNSQRVVYLPVSLECCISYVKDTISKAIHNHCLT